MKVQAGEAHLQIIYSLDLRPYALENFHLNCEEMLHFTQKEVWIS
jgi:hypothetical protein